MKQCLIYDNSLRFSRALYGTLALIAFLIHNHWLVLITGLLMAFGAFSIKFNIPYQFHALVLRKLPKERVEPIQKESGELVFVSSMGGALFFISFLLLYFEKFVVFTWILILIIALLLLFAFLTGTCVTSLMYAVFKKSVAYL